MSRSLASVLRAVAKSDSTAAQVARRLATPVFQRMDLVVPARLAGGGVLYVELANEVGRTIWLRGEYRSEKPIKDLIVSILRPGDVFFDIGANVGFFSLVGAQAVGEKGAVHAFEPLPHLAALIRRTVARNKLANVRVLEMAVSASTRAVQMAAMKDSAYSHILEGASKVDAGRGGCTRRGRAASRPPTCFTPRRWPSASATTRSRSTPRDRTRTRRPRPTATS